MRKALLVAAAAALAAVPPAGAQTVIDFESFMPCDNARPNVGVIGSADFMRQWTCYPFPQPNFTPRSGTNRIYAVSGGANAPTGSFRFTTLATFGGAWFSGEAPSPITAATTVTFELFLGGSLVATSAALEVSPTPQFLASGYAGPVDMVTVSGSSTRYVMDDVAFAVLAPPEPATAALLAGGLAALGGVARRRRRA